MENSLNEKILELKGDKKFCVTGKLGIYVGRFIALLEKFAEGMKQNIAVGKVSYSDYIKARRKFFKLRGNLETMFKRQYMLMYELNVNGLNGNVEEEYLHVRKFKNHFAKLFLDALAPIPKKISRISFLLSANAKKKAEELIKFTKQLDALVHWLGKIQNQEIERLKLEASVDSLTGLPNRRFLLNYLEREIERLKHMQGQSKGKSKGKNKKSKKEGYLHLFFVEIDNFKRFNTEYGHLYGDMVLKLVAKYLRNGTRLTRSVDVVGRYGGDEFMVVMHNIKIKDAEKIAERLLKHVSNNVTYEFSKCLGKNAKPPKITISIGISAFLHDSTTLQELIEHADKAMKYAKNVLGKAAWHRYSAALDKKNKYDFTA
jgi:diguanylate cyclase (GGDEF)-like protein